MNEILDQIALWMHKQPAAVAYIVGCVLAVAQTFAIYGR